MARSLGGDFHLCAAEPRRQEVTWGIPGIIEAAGDVAGLWTGVRCPGETCTLSLCVPPFYSGSCNVIGQVALLLFFPFQLRLLATRESQPWGEIHLRNVCWLRHQAEKGVGWFAAQKLALRPRPEHLLLPACPSLARRCGCLVYRGGLSPLGTSEVVTALPSRDSDLSFLEGRLLLH